jgi:HSP20 family protein
MSTDVQIPNEQPAAAPEQDATPSTLHQVRLRPEADIYRSKQEVRLIVDLPGARDEDVDVEVHDGVLSITARVQRNESELRVYERSFRLDRKMNTEAIQANLERGVLTLTLPFHEEAQPRKISIQTSEA